VLAVEDELQGEYPVAGTVALLADVSSQTQELANVVLEKDNRNIARGIKYILNVLEWVP
jgi:hypothetical protein